MGAMRFLLAALAAALAACTELPAPTAHSFAWLPAGVCPGGVRVEALFPLSRVERDGAPVEVRDGGFLLARQDYPTTYEEAEATPPWTWEGAVRAYPAGAGPGTYRFTCLPQGLPPLELALDWDRGNQVAVAVLEDARAPSGLRVGVRRW